MANKEVDESQASDITRIKKKLMTAMASKPLKRKRVRRVVEVLRRLMPISTINGTNPVEVLEVTGGTRDLALRLKDC